jgi:GNAT superfamily N-acetyltransferase
MGAVAVERRAAADDEELFRLYQDVFGNELTENSRKRWLWQYRENPATSAEGPEIWVARDGEALLGQYASMPVRLWWGGREVRASWGMDVFVRKEARGRGVGAVLFTTWSDNVEVALGLGLTPSSYGLFKKLRYADVGPVPFYRKVLDARAVASRRLGPALGALAAPMLRLSLALAAPERRGGAEGIEVTTVTAFGSEYDELWEKARASYAMCVRRDAAYLRWKYQRAPHRRYEVREARRGGQLLGFAVSRHEEHRGLRLGWILDVFADAADHGAKRALIADALDGFRAAGVARAQAFSMNAALGGDLRALGFLPGPSPMQFCVRSRVEDGGALRDTGRWQVVFGDSDMDR